VYLLQILFNTVPLTGSEALAAFAHTEKMLLLTPNALSPRLLVANIPENMLPFARLDVVVISVGTVQKATVSSALADDSDVSFEPSLPGTPIRTEGFVPIQVSPSTCVWLHTQCLSSLICRRSYRDSSASRLPPSGR
jgi:hypothetical protein